MMKKAAAEAEDIIRLNDGDNLGIRYNLAFIYAYLEEEEKLLKLIKKYDEESVEFYLALSMLYFRLDNMRRATNNLKKAQSVNKFTKKFIIQVIDEDVYVDFSNSFYEYNSLEHLNFMYVDNDYIFEDMLEYPLWADSKLNG
ncbi:tetratricopeptide (TPR) repeat protein [Peptoniphilus olsenii]|uniref:Tetratricopeptide (TPR) repeat protein n=1 Tax=Peptoniphilus olsenii TaxID=411570 RepID=A0ABV2JAG0_9FIRM